MSPIRPQCVRGLLSHNDSDPLQLTTLSVSVGVCVVEYGGVSTIVEKWSEPPECVLTPEALALPQGWMAGAGLIEILPSWGRGDKAPRQA